MGGGNGQKAKMARERNLEKQKAAKGSQLETNKNAMSIQVACLLICLVMFCLAWYRVKAPQEFYFVPPCDHFPARDVTGNGPQRSMASLPNQARTDSLHSGRNATSRQSPIKRGLSCHIASVPNQAWTDRPLRDSPQSSADCLAT
ncbi:hypothetical protein ACLB2K_017032 [Fragaria x ananassa]